MARTFKCERCGRVFSMAAHLARHMNAGHGVRRAGKRTAAGKRGRPRGRAARPKATRTRAARYDAGGATRLVGEMQAYHSELAARRAAVDQEIAAIENAMAAMGGASRRAPRAQAKRRVARPKAARRAARPTGGRGVRAGSLKAYIDDVLRKSGKPMSPKDIATAVMRAGYKTKAQNLVRAVSNALTDVKGIKRVGHGQYRM